jgi:hypothetical protein
VNHGRFCLPLYDGAPPVALIAAITKLGPTRALAEAELDLTIRLLDDACVFVRLADGRRSTELSTAVCVCLSVCLPVLSSPRCLTICPEPRRHALHAQRQDISPPATRQPPARRRRARGPQPLGLR